MESFSSPPQKNVLDRRRWHTRVELRRAIVVLIENLHHRSRRQDTFGRMTRTGRRDTLTQSAHAP
jgi:putative transposase